MSPGDMISADIDTETVRVNLVVNNQALQEIEGNVAVFVRSGDRYTAVPVQTGRHDEHHTEIISGLQPGDEYVSENSYLIKADIGKSGAAHEH